MYVLRTIKSNEKSGDYLSQPFRAATNMVAPEGQRLEWAETSLFRPSAALAASRLISLGVLNPQNRWHRALFVRGVRTIHNLPKVLGDGTTVEPVIYAILLGVAKSGEVNRRRQHVLNRAHWQFAYRIMQWFGKSCGHGPVKDSLLSYQVFKQLLDEGVQTAAELSA